MGSRNFRLVAIKNVQLGSRWAGLLLFIPISGYDVCGDNMLGSRWVCSGSSRSIVAYIWLVTSVPQKDLILSRALLCDINDSKKAVLFSGLFLGPLQIELICGSNLWYRAKQEDS
jgi:hypothetical protein